MEFHEVLEQLGFGMSQDRTVGGTQTYSSSPNRFLTYWVHLFDDGTALFTWEFAITDYVRERGMQLGSGEALNVYLFPTQDDRGPQEAGWLAGAIDRAEARLGDMDFIAPDA